jgi:hypothetical protein
MVEPSFTEEPFRILSANQHLRAAKDNRAAVRCLIAHASSRQAIDQNGHRAKRDHIWRPNAGSQIGRPGCRQPTDQNVGRSQGDWSAYMRHQHSHEWANVHIG